jgi:antitoxin ParD1/3/4/toxin ParE1/3/4
VTRYRLTVEAAQDLADIEAYLAQHAGPGVALHVLGRMRRAIERIARLPGIGHVRRDVTDQPVRFWKVYSYLVIYDPAPRPIHIIRVLHGSRDIAALLGPRG